MGLHLNSNIEPVSTLIQIFTTACSNTEIQQLKPSQTCTDLQIYDVNHSSQGNINHRHTSNHLMAPLMSSCHSLGVVHVLMMFLSICPAESWSVCGLKAAGTAGKESLYLGTKLLVQRCWNCSGVWCTWNSLLLVVWNDKRHEHPCEN